jgi:hypothetical protein
MVEILAIALRRHFDGKPNLHSSGVRYVFGTGRGQAKHLGELLVYGLSQSWGLSGVLMLTIVMTLLVVFALHYASSRTTK